MDDQEIYIHDPVVFQRRVKVGLEILCLPHAENHKHSVRIPFYPLGEVQGDLLSNPRLLPPIPGARRGLGVKQPREDTNRLELVFRKLCLGILCPRKQDRPACSVTGFGSSLSDRPQDRAVGSLQPDRLPEKPGEPPVTVCECGSVQGTNSIRRLLVVVRGRLWE